MTDAPAPAGALTWFGSIGVAIITGLGAMIGAGFAAALAVEWYHVPSREGESGYLVVGLAILGLLAGFVIGLVASRVIAASARPGFGRSLGTSLGIVLGLIGLVTGTVRVLADVPPTIDGETLVLSVEVRYPASRMTTPAIDTAEGRLTLHSIPHLSHTVRTSQNGPLWKQDARLVGGHWVVPGAVNLFTGRGKRMLEFNPGDSTHLGFLIPLGGRPGRADLVWSEWLPRARPGSAALPDQVTIRYRVQKGSEVIRTQAVGPFEIGTTAGWYYEGQVDGRTTSLSDARFVISSNGHPLRLQDSASVRSVSVVGDGLIVQTRPDDAGPSCYLVTTSHDGPSAKRIGDCGGYSIESIALTNDLTRFRDQARHQTVTGRIDEQGFRQPGEYLIGNAVVDTRTAAVYSISSDSIYTPIPSVLPIGVAPDQRSMVRFGYSIESSDSLVLAVTDFAADRSYTLPVDPRRMRYPDLEALDPAWLAHHFEWVTAGNGHDSLVERRHFTPIPYSGSINEEEGAPVYRIEKAGRQLRMVLIDFLAREFKAELAPADSDAYELPLRVSGKTINVAASSDFDYVLVSMPADGRDSALIVSIGQRFNRLLATGKYDSLFGP